LNSNKKYPAKTGGVFYFCQNHFDFFIFVAIIFIGLSGGWYCTSGGGRFGSVDLLVFPWGLSAYTGSRHLRLGSLVPGQGVAAAARSSSSAQRHVPWTHSRPACGDSASSLMPVFTDFTVRYLIQRSRLAHKHFDYKFCN